MSVGYLGEIFSGIQGEGLCLGQRHLFVRFLGCNLRCAYCDTAWARERGLYCRAEQTPGARDFAEYVNPLEATRAAQLMLRLNSPPGLHATVSFTGGEPLLQPEFLRDLALAARGTGLKAYLETNGTLAAALTQVLQVIDIIAMDVKLPSAAGFECWEEHRAFLRAAAPLSRHGGSALFVKAVFVRSTPTHEIERLARLIAGFSVNIPLVLQPVSAVPQGPEPPSPGQALALQAAAQRHLAQVRVIPQVHKLMGQM